MDKEIKYIIKYCLHNNKSISVDNESKTYNDIIRYCNDNNIGIEFYNINDLPEKLSDSKVIVVHDTFAKSLSFTNK